METELLKWLRDGWLKFRSIPIIVILCLIGYFAIIAKIKELYGIEWLSNNYYLILLPFLFLILLYTVLCAYHYRLPSAPKNSFSALFVINAESNELYEAVRFKLANSFRITTTNITSPSVNAICIPRQRVAKCDLSNKSQAIDLLKKTNCIFLVDVKYSVDDVSQAEHYEMSINYGICHPSFEGTIEKILSTDMCALGSQFGKQRFVKAQLLEVFDITAQTLSLVCQYLLGFVYLVLGNTETAHELLWKLHTLLSEEKHNFPTINLLKNLVKNRLFAVYIKVSTDNILLFEKGKEKTYLHHARNALLDANQLYPNTYIYNINMAYIYIILDRNTKKAKECIDNCKTAKKSKEWKYSEAFLCAYKNNASGSVFAKYKQALSIPVCNLVSIVDYIEYVLSVEPARTTLHLAAGLVYEAMGDPIQMKIHFAKYLDSVPASDTKARDIIIKKVAVASCNVNCNNNCIDCNGTFKI